MSHIIEGKVAAQVPDAEIKRQSVSSATCLLFGQNLHEGKAGLKKMLEDTEQLNQTVTGLKVGQKKIREWSSSLEINFDCHIHKRKNHIICNPTY